MAEPSRLCLEQRLEAAATLGASHWEGLRFCFATENLRMHRCISVLRAHRRKIAPLSRGLPAIGSHSASLRGLVGARFGAFSINRVGQPHVVFDSSRDSLRELSAVAGACDQLGLSRVR